jgi:hypothetical protein
VTAIPRSGGAAVALAVLLIATLSVVRLAIAGSDDSANAPQGQPESGPLTSSARCARWVATRGSDANAGTRAAPWATLAHAAATVRDGGCTVWFEDGVYTAHTEIDRRFTERTTFRAVHPYHVTLQSDQTVLEIDGASKTTFRGFDFRHVGPGAIGLLVYTSEKNGKNARHLSFVDNIFHDSYDNDLMKLHDGTRSATVRNNVFYNQGDAEEHMDINSVANVTIEGNIFFNDFARSGRNVNDSKHFITVKDSNGNSDGLLGSHHVSIRRNIFMNWEGEPYDGYLNIGNDGQPFYEAVGVAIQNNLMIGNSRNQMDAPFSVAGAKDVRFVNNTVAGDQPCNAYAFRLYIKDENPRNSNIVFVNNIWSDPTGTMGAVIGEMDGDFSAGDPGDTTGLVLDRNLYWNGGKTLAHGDLVSPTDDKRAVVRDPMLNTDQSDVVAPYWDGSAFPGGGTTIQQEFQRLVTAYAAIPSTSAAVGEADRSLAPADDILGRRRDARPDLGAFEAQPA